MTATATVAGRLTSPTARRTLRAVVAVEARRCLTAPWLWIGIVATLWFANSSTQVTFAAGALFVQQNDRAKVRLIAQSETLFDNRGLGLQFVKDSAGVVTHLFDKHVSGDYRFQRVK